MLIFIFKFKFKFIIILLIFLNIYIFYISIHSSQLLLIIAKKYMRRMMRNFLRPKKKEKGEVGQSITFITMKF